ncbi:outer membrane autotransporter protein [Luteibacter rhizovicinus]|uniref:Outer membrane autotransporter protein n=1 Tax=Luteibacter rhizovicinus TaxID=242606 RepID=A0A4R3YL70_9GAMM|nr:autotransporter outer membrane beta-barrel domain-containing protein [Luteibacter rhizovicinus]TCV92902.1 outer membrane autotransporter protein [Luteibacter rhizovicinus]
MSTDNRSGVLPRRSLVLALAAALAPFSYASAQQVVAGPTEILTPAAGTYTTTADGEPGHAFRAHGGGVINAVDDMILTTSGAGAFGISSEGAGSSVTVAGGQIATTGSQAHAVSATSGGEISITGNDISSPMHVQTSGVDSHAVRLSGAGTRGTVSKTNIATLGNGSYGARIEGGASIDFAGGVDVRTGGTDAHAISATGQGSKVTAQATFITTGGDRSVGLFVQDGARANIAGSVIVTTGAQSHGMDVAGSGTSAIYSGGSITTSGDGAFGIRATDSGIVNLSSTDVSSNGTASAIYADNANVTLDATNVYSLYSGIGALHATNGSTVRIVNGSTVGVEYEQAAGITVEGGAAGPTRVDIVDSRVYSTFGPAIRLGAGSTHVRAENTRLEGETTMLHATSGADGVLELVRSNVTGDAIADAGARASVFVAEGSVWSGAANHLADISIDGTSRWNIAADSTAAHLALDGNATFTGPVGGFSTLTLANDLTGSGGVIGMRARLGDTSGLPDASDRVLIEGNVTTTGTTLIDVAAQGSGAWTDSNRDGKIDATEGLSLVQVAGTSRADAFALRGGYVAAGPFQYVLKAFGPGEASQSQSALASGPIQWDYRLGNTFLCEGKPCDPTDPTDPGEGDNGAGHDEGRPAVVPQLPSYLVAPTAFLAYGGQVTDTLHQRLGEIRNVVPGSHTGGEMFVRYIGSRQSYRSDLDFNRYGYGFRQQNNTLQLGGSILSFAADTSVLRAGWAIDKGTTSVTPSAADGRSHARYDASGVSAWLTWQDVGGMYVDGILGGRRFSGDVGTDLRGEDVARLHASQVFASVEAGYPFAIGNGWTLEPQVQARWQSVRLRAFDDKDGVAVDETSASQTTHRIGIRAGRMSDPVFAPYLRADLLHTVGRRQSLTAGDGTTDYAFELGRPGTQYRVGAGGTYRFATDWSVYGEGDYQGSIGSTGFRGFSATLGVRLNF